MKKMKTSFFKFVLVLTAFTLNYSAMAADYYWIGGSGLWNDDNHWSLNSGGASAGSVPTADDNVHFDDNSFLNGSSAVFLTENTDVQSVFIESQTSLNLSGFHDLFHSGHVI